MINRRGRWLDGKGRGHGWEHILLLYHQLQMLLQITSLSTSEGLEMQVLNQALGFLLRLLALINLRGTILSISGACFHCSPKKTNTDVFYHPGQSRSTNCLSSPVALDVWKCLSETNNYQQLFQGFLSVCPVLPSLPALLKSLVFQCPVGGS